MARRIAASDLITLSLGAVGFTGAMTIAAVVRMGTDAAPGTAQVFMWVGTSSGDTRYWFGTLGTSLNFRVGASTGTAPTLTATVANGWVLAAFSVAAGTATPRFSKYVYATDVWSFEDYGSSVGDGLTPTGNAYLGNSPTAANGMQNGDEAIVAAWNAQLTDMQIMSLSEDLSYTNWSGAVKPQAFWIPGSAADSVVDRTGKGANQTAVSGTTTTPDEHPLLNRQTRALVH